MNSISLQVCLVLTIALTALGNSFNGTCGIEGKCSNPVELKQDQGIDDIKCKISNLFSFIHILADSSNTADECLKKCQRTEGCQWSSFDKKSRTCHMFEDCHNVFTDDCVECTTSLVGCAEPECDLTGFCKVDISVIFM